MNSIEEIRKLIEPDAIYGSAPFWAWNSDMDAGKIKKTLQSLKDNGFGGAFVHPRPGLTNEYLSEEWFSLWREALEEARKLGMKLYIYDENTYPTGYAGGHIMSMLPDCAARSVKVRIFGTKKELVDFLDDAGRAPEEKCFLKLYEAELQEGSLDIQRDVTEESWEEYKFSGCLVAAFPQQPYASAWFGGFPNTDILRPEVTRALLDTTYEEYWKRFGEEFGELIPAIFSDEPGISPGSVELEDPMAFPFSRYLAAEFYDRRGYSLVDNMVSLVLDIPGIPGGVQASRVRYDYYCTLRELWVENFAEPISRWCREHHIAWTGHFLDEHWPYPWGCCSPAVMSMYEYMQWPGIDMLMSHMLRGDGRSPMLLSVKELSSAGEQMGKERLLCECYGAGGWDASVTDFKRIGDWLAVNGVNFFNQHLTLESVSGARKYGHPQSFDSREPWWEEYGRLTPYYARISSLLSAGRAKHRLLVLHPTTSWFLKTPSEQKGDILWKFEEMPADYPVKTYIGLLMELADENIGYDLGDEFLMGRHGRVDKGRLYVGRCSYTAVVIPQEMEHMMSSTAALLEEAAASGVDVISLGENCKYRDGREWFGPKLSARLVDRGTLSEEMKRAGYQPVNLEGKGISCRKIVLNNGKNGEALLFLVNSTPERQSGRMSLTDGTLWETDLFTGETRTFAFGEGESLASFSLELETCQSRMLYLVPDAGEGNGTAAVRSGNICDPCREKKEKEYQLEPQNIRLLEDNVLVVDYGTLFLRDKVYSDIYVMEACDKVYQAHGLEKDPWDMSVQFKKTYTDKNNFKENSGFIMAYYFEIEKIPERLYLAAEQPGISRLKVNGREVSWEEGRYFLDTHIGMADIREFVKEGDNTALIEVSPFDLDMEIQPIYILGNFSLKEEKDFIIGEKRPIRNGGLREQGVVFYGGRVSYEYDVCFEEIPDGCSLILPEFEASALSIYVNGQYAGTAGIGLGEVYPIEQFCRQGNNEIRVELSCSLKNLFGPFHTRETIRNSAWPGAWRLAPAYGKPEPSKYDTISYGLKGPLFIKTVMLEK